MGRDIEPRHVGPYHLEACLGEGGMGIVYRAYDERLDRRVALKKIHSERAGDSETRRAFRREARLAAQLNHPALVQVHDILEVDGFDWIVMEWVEGTSLAQVLTAGPLDPASALSMSRAIADGLAAAHRLGIVHRDLKTENVMITTDGAPKILDFGLAVLPKEHRREDSSPTPSSRMIGTPRAISPERARGHESDPRSDLFSLGILLYEMVSRHSPFLGAGAMETLVRACCEDPDPVRVHAPTLSHDFADLIDRLLRKEPAERPQTADDVVHCLDRILDAEPDRSSSLATAPHGVAGDSGPSSEATIPVPLHLQGECRHLAILCCELTGSGLDPDHLYEQTPPFHRMVFRIVERYEGHFRDLQGHRFVACFGFPRSSEHNTRRAVEAGLEILSRGPSELSGLAVKVAVHSGPSVVLASARGERVILGKTLDIAWILLQQTPLDSLLVSASSRRYLQETLSGERFAVRLGDRNVPTEALLVDRHTSLPDELATAVSGTPHLVGRGRELEFLAGRCRLASDGVGQAVLVVGEPGIGKSRLLRAARDRLATEAGSPPWIVVHAAPYRRSEASHPITSLLRQLLTVDAEAPPARQLERLRRALFELDLPMSDAMPLLEPLLDPSGVDRSKAGPTSRQLELVPDVVSAAAARLAPDQCPLVLVFEDLHDLDTRSLDMVGAVLDTIPSCPIFCIASCRPGFQLPWKARWHVSRVALGPLTSDETAELVDHLAHGHPLEPATRERLATRSDGVPRFVEALVAQQIEVESADPTSVPVGLVEALTARLDRLGAAREILEVSACLGPSFRSHTIAHLTAWDDASLTRELGRLVEAGLLVRCDDGEAFAFRQTLVREAAASLLLEEDRDSIRRRIDPSRLET